LGGRGGGEWVDGSGERVSGMRVGWEEGAGEGVRDKGGKKGRLGEGGVEVG